MKIVIGIAAFLIVAVAAFLILGRQRVKTKDEPKRAKSAEACRELRQQILTMDPEAAGIADFSGTNQVWGVVMESGFPEATVTLVALADGNASLYFSSGGGVIGGVGHDAVRKAALRMTQVADAFVSACSPTTDFPFPKEGETTFYILTKNGKITAKARENDLGEQRHELAPLFYAGQDVISQLRLVTNDFK